MKLGAAFHALSIAMASYDAYPEEVAKLIRDKFDEDGRVYFQGAWMNMDMFIFNLPRYKRPEDIMLTWWGGPPKKEKWLTGSLILFLYDRLQRELLVRHDERHIVYDFVYERMQEQMAKHELEHGI